tara:strand:- start:28531 stop:29463 length:933 start_codon:yes stop_codon:yes gene_type:complete
MKNNLSNIKKAKYYLDKDECIAIPTETVYGLAGNAYSDKASLRIFKLKKRNKKNPLIVHYSNLEMLNKDCFINSEFNKLYKKFCPGPITFVLKLKKQSNISKNVTNNKKTLAVRFPNHPKTKKLLKSLNYPLAAPSANISTKISPVSKRDVKEEFGKKIKFILDGGRSKIGLESTIVSLVGKTKILRLGGIENSKINKVLNKNLKFHKTNNRIAVPGQSRLHYSPGIPIRLNVSKPKPYEAFILIKKRNKTFKNYYYLSKTKNLKQAGRNLYKTLRIIKNKNYKSIAVEQIPNIGFGETINDRLKRASVK